ncbi:MAG: peptidoglycan-associated lipoprotein [Comamonadaceae bacterium]|nr:MAG: peptidoglycan-associated lipoprotein [Comamonadaceae bacterium]
MNLPFILGAVAVSAVVSGCAIPSGRGVDTVNYYYANKEGPRPSITRRTPPPAVPAPTPAAQPAPREPAGVPRFVYFDFDRAEVKPQDRPVIAAHAEFLRGSERARVTLDGHADARGSNDYNRALGLRRAEAVRRSLVRQGVAEGRVEALSDGEEKPASTMANETGFRLNRRVEFVYR